MADSEHEDNLDTTHDELADIEATVLHERRSQRPHKPNPKYTDDDDKTRTRDMKRQWIEQVKALQKIFAATSEHMDNNEVELVTKFAIALEKRRSELRKLHQLYTACKITKEEKTKSEELIEIFMQKQQNITDWLKGMNDEEEDDSEPEDIDMEDIRASLETFKKYSKNIVKSQTKALTDIATSLKDSLLAPKQEIKKFKGDPQTYQMFVSSFEAATSSIKDPRSKLNYLVQSCENEARDVIETYIILEPEEGFEKAKQALQKRYGRPHTVARSFINNLVNGPAIKQNDPEAISRLALDMSNCQLTLTKLGYTADLDSSDSLLKIVRRLPHHMRSKWAERADVIIENGDEPKFSHLTSFLERQARVATNLYGLDISRNHTQPSKPQRGKTFATVTTPSHPNSPSRSYPQNQTQSQGDQKCGFCGANHQTWRCDQFLKLSYAERRNATRTKGLCDNCFERGHISRDCPKRKFCSVQNCSLRYKHSTYLHPPNQPAQNNAYFHYGQSVQPTPLLPTPPQLATVPTPLLPTPPPHTTVPTLLPPTETSLPNANNFATNSGAAVCLKVVPVKVYANDRVIETFALLDNCSDMTMCSKSLTDKLKVQGHKDELSINTVNGDKNKMNAEKINLMIESMNNDQVLQLDEVYAVQNLNIPSDIIIKQEDLLDYPHLQDIELPRTTASNVELLIGSDHPSVFWTLDERRGSPTEPVAVKTILGWTAIGPVNRHRRGRSFTSNFIKMTLEESVERMWTTEFNDLPSQKPSMSVEDHQALDIMTSSTKKIDGHYEVSLPWKFTPPRLENNIEMAKARLRSLKTKLTKDPDFKDRYCKEIEKYINNGHAQEAKHKSLDSIKWYLPHHAVLHPQKPDKTRVVFDCSAQYRGTSLNKQLLQGPDLLNDLVGVLLRFREHPVAISSDIENMFHQVRVTPQDADALRFLWWKDGDLTKDPLEYQMLVHLFGATSSPSVCCYILRKTAEDNAHLYTPETVKTVLHNFYMDDCLKSVESVDEAVKLQMELRSLLKRGGFNLRKWTSNSKEVLASIPESERAPSIQNLTLDELPTERTLGVQWNIERDEIEFTPKVKAKPTTKRGVLSTVSSLYDPLGLVSPVILTARIFYQQLCRDKYEWDQEIDIKIAQRWEEWLQTLPALTSISIPRCYRPPSSQPVRAELHHFSDASESGYGAVSYLRFEDETGQIHCSIVMGKARLAPIKTISIPRLELSAAVVAVRLNTMLKDQLTLPIVDTFYWTDATSVLQYIRNTDKRFKTYVANRLTVIHEGSKVSQWKHVRGKQNPADYASRGLMPTDSEKLQIWHSGPDFLWMKREHWPKQPESIPPLEDDDEVKRECCTFYTHETDESSINDLIKRHSSWHSLQKSFAWLARFKEYCMYKFLKDKPKPTNDPLSVQELREATDDIVKFVQRKMFLKDINSIQKNPKKRTKGDLCKLNPVMMNGVVRVGGRLQNARIPESQKHPIILPGQHHVTDLILRHHHAALGHSGSDMVLNSVRKQFWITSGKYAVRKIIST